MKICTITCHNVYNHGASLQAYGLLRYLKCCGHDVEIIDYKPKYLSNHYKLFSIDNPKWKKNILSKAIYLTLKLPKRILSLKRKKAFDEFSSKHLIITKTRFTSNNELKKNTPNADAYLCGSDQIWNCLHENGKDPAFYLDFTPSNKIKAAYAASFATDTISEEYIPVIKERVERLDGVGVREKSGVKILERMNVTNTFNVVDPVFLLEQEEWSNLGKIDFREKYILIYDFDNSILIKKLALEIAKERNCKIYNINPSKLKYADRYFNYAGPEIFIALVKNAQFVISNSFHAAVFSIVYEKDFVIVNRTEAINTRMRDLLDDLKLNERLADENYSLEKLMKKVDYSESKKILNEKIQFSKKYLKEVLSISK
ncbi:polysaccharide pyruvyl transferase family protein [Paenibacillus eucommiae]|uniref:Polysaccharide pyruvyl transferase domain-containing protein n=1 Tax=Paenibacillus eucommiae TaxID=1355755 RepID=A0ABS4IS23_9BACL|nr:polysaccharide pyruvyl transferase family protein [Paenibacillus eucommiae]MBP1990379.1 hypothetical protein [Paenibacillus eucommiae]